MARMELNDDLNGVEIYFDSMPDEDIRNEMKAINYRWHRAKKCWYAKQNEDTMALANRLCGGEAACAKKTQAKKAAVVSSVENIMNKRCCYASYVSEFYKVGEADFIKAMKSAFSTEYLMSLGSEQVGAWKDCFRVMQDAVMDPEDGIIFEYALPYESGRRPDVLLVSREHVVILEFKMKNKILEADIDQVAAYARDISEYHFESREKSVTPVLVLTRTEGIDKMHRGVHCVSADNLQSAIDDYTEDTTKTDIETWMNSKYEPLPTIVDAARNFMVHGDLPNLRAANSKCIPQAIKCLTDVTRDAQKKKKHVLALVTGVPGAGKTYLGLQYVYDICDSNENVNSVYLSGNGPLVRVLTDALNSKVFVKNIHTVVNEFVAGKAGDFQKNVIVFDEGQRAWDKKQMSESRGTNSSEPDVLVELCDEQLDWCVLLILVGEGQEINKGENSGLGQWNTAIGNSTEVWEIICPDKLKSIFKEKNVITNSALNLDKSLRTHKAENVSKFVNAFIAGDISEARSYTDEILDEHFDMYYTRDLQAAKDYCINRYGGNLNKHFGLMASSKGYSLAKYGMKPGFKPSVEKWFNGIPGTPGSCAELKVTISEFDCQGLEVDMPIVGWANDMMWTGSGWKTNAATDEDANAYRINSYRVLLTRGRDGFIVFIPPTSEFDVIEDVFEKAGVPELDGNAKWM